MPDKRNCNEQILSFIKAKIRGLSKRGLLSTFSYIKWEKEFLGLMADPKNANFLVQLESRRLPSILHSNGPDNFLTHILYVFDQAVALTYEADIRAALNDTCQKFRSLSYKVHSLK